MYQSHIGEVTMGGGTRIGFALVMAINLVVLLYATRNYRHIRGPLSPQANKRRWWLASIVGIIMIGLLYLAFKETLGLTWVLFGVAVGFAGLYILTRHFW